MLPLDAAAYEITHTEWDSLTGGAYRNLTVTTRQPKVDCRAEIQKRAIGSGSGYAIAGVAVVKIRIPDEFRNRNLRFDFVCFE
jgi:hypothetical protein